MKKVAAVVVLYNATLDHIKNIKSYSYGVDKLYIVDNSLNSNIHYFELEDKFEYYHYSENIGLARALNVAAKKAFNDGYQWLLTMDQDSRFEEEDFKQYLKESEQYINESVAIFSPWHQTSYSVLKPDLLVEEVDYIMTSGNLVNLNILNKLDFFCEWLFIDGIDMEYCFRVRKLGYKIIRVNTIELTHELGDAIKHTLFGRVFETTNHSALRRYYIVRNSSYLKDMYYDMDPDFWEINSEIKKMCTKIVLFEKHKFSKLIAVYRAKRDYKKGIKGKKDED